MSYNSSIPQPTDRLKDSQPQLLANFQAIDTYVAVNHVGFGTADSGKHKYIELPVQTPSPPIAFPAGEVALYSFLNTLTNKNELYVNKTNQATIVQVPATASVLSVTNFPGNGSTGWTYLPSGIIMKWGNGSTAGGGEQTFTFPVDATTPAFTQCFNVQITIIRGLAGDPNLFATVHTVTPTTFTMYAGQRTNVSSPAQNFFYWLAIGR